MTRRREPPETWDPNGHPVGLGVKVTELRKERDAALARAEKLRLRVLELAAWLEEANWIIRDEIGDDGDFDNCVALIEAARAEAQP